MPVSSGLEAYFNKKRKTSQVAQKFDDVCAHIDPAFCASFAKFRAQVLEIVDENPEVAEYAGEQVQAL